MKLQRESIIEFRIILISNRMVFIKYYYFNIILIISFDEAIKINPNDIAYYNSKGI